MDKSPIPQDWIVGYVNALLVAAQTIVGEARREQAVQEADAVMKMLQTWKAGANVRISS
jgi:hypothetical protein